MKTKTRKIGRIALWAFSLSFAVSGVSAQGVSINGTGARADTSAILDVTSSTKGVLISRMTTVQRDAIFQPAVGLRIYNTDTNCDNIYSGSYWTKICGVCDFDASVASSNSPVGAGGTLNLTGTPVTNATYYWTGPDNFTSNTLNASISNFQGATHAGEYKLTTTVNGCTSSPSVIQVTLQPPVVVTFNATGTGRFGTIQAWVVPAGVSSVEIEAWGAQGGNATSTYVGGKGARMKGTFSVTPGETIRILVGQQGVGGTNSQSSHYASGGGGGTFVQNQTTNTLLMAAGGGGGGYYYSGNAANGFDGTTSSSGTSGQGGIGGGSGGNGGQCSNGGCSAGYSGDGTYSARSFLNGGDGGLMQTDWGSYGLYGGFGGGGGAGLPSGGGGGYSGGGGGTWSSQGAGGGGGSYNIGTNPDNASGARSGHGLVTITY